jgi:hypothetical protein
MLTELAVGKIYVTAVAAVVAVKVALSSMMWTEQTYCLEIWRALSVLIYINHFLTCQFVSFILYCSIPIYLEGGSSRLLQNIGTHLPNYIT